MAAVLPVVPLTALPPGVADWLATALVLAALVAALWLLDVRDWRVYGVVLLWPSVIEAIQTANASLPLTLLVALMWRYRDRAAIAGLALGYGDRGEALPLAGRRLARARRPPTRCGRRGRRRPRRRCSCCCRSRASPTTCGCCGTSARRSSTTPTRRSRCSPTSACPTPPRARSPSRSASAVLALAWRRRSLGLALAAALVLSPIVWRHFFALLLVPLALSRPRFDAVWLIPIGLWVGDGTFNGAPWQTACVLALVALTFVLCDGARGPRRASVAHAGAPPLPRCRT